MKEEIKLICTISIIVQYFLNYILMFMYEPLEILISEIVVWLLIILIMLGIAFVDWLNS